MQAEREYGGFTAREIEAGWLKLPGGIVAWDLVKHVNQLLKDSAAMQEQLQQQAAALTLLSSEHERALARLEHLAAEQYREHVARCAKLNQIPTATLDAFSAMMWAAIDQRIDKQG